MTLSQQQELLKPVKEVKKRRRKRHGISVTAVDPNMGWKVSAWGGWEAAGVPVACNGSSQFTQTPPVLAESSSSHQHEVVMPQQQGEGQNEYISMLSSEAGLQSDNLKSLDDESLLQEATANLTIQHFNQYQHHHHQQQQNPTADNSGSISDASNVAVLERGSAEPQHAVNGHERPQSQHLNHIHSGTQPVAGAARALSSQAPSSWSMWESAGLPTVSGSSPRFLPYNPAPSSSNGSHSCEDLMHHENGHHENGHHLQQPLPQNDPSYGTHGSSLGNGLEQGVQGVDGAAVLLEDVHIVTSRAEAARVAQHIAEQYSSRWFAVDTEVSCLQCPAWC